MNPASTKRRQLALAACLLAATVIGPPQPSYATDATRIEQIAAELNIPRRAWTICTVNDIGRAVQAEPTADPTAMADRALTACAAEEQALQAKATDLLGRDAAERLMTRLEVEAHEALIGSARTLTAAKAAGGRIDPAWPRVLAPAP